jgi:hypothetical protein
MVLRRFLAGSEDPHGETLITTGLADLVTMGSVLALRARSWPAIALPLPILVALAGLPIIALRRSSPSLVWDDGPVFWAGAAGGLPSIVEPYGGYFHPLARSIALLGRVLDAPPVLWLGALVVALFVAAYVASDHLVPVLPVRWQRFAVGISILVLPGTIQTLGLVGQLQWYGLVFLLAWLIAGSANRVALGLFALTGPYSAVLAPLVLLRRPTGWQIVLAGAIVQAAGYLISPRSAGFELEGLGPVLAFRGVLSPLLGEVSVVSTPAIAALPVAVIAAAAIWADRALWPVWAGGAIVAVLGVSFAGETNDVLLLGPGARYFVALSFGFVLFAVRNPRHWLAWAVAALLVVGIVDDFRIPIRDYYGWQP